MYSKAPSKRPKGEGTADAPHPAARSDDGAAPPTPRWVMVFAVVVLLVLVLVARLLFAGGGGDGAGRNALSGNGSNTGPPADVTRGEP